MTSTLVELKVPMLSLLSPGLKQFVADALSGPNGFGREMGLVGSNIVKHHGQAVVVPYCREIELQIAVMDEVSGQTETCMLDILLHTKGDANRSRVKITSELPSDEHGKMVQKLIAAIEADAGTSSPTG